MKRAGLGNGVLDALLVAVTTLVILTATRLHDPNSFDNFLLLADALLHGHVWVAAQAGIDSVVFGGKNYIIEGPFPALLLVPFVAIFGIVPVAQQELSVVAGVVAIVAFWALFGRLGLKRIPRVMLSAFVFAGTNLWSNAVTGWVWFVSPVVAVALTGICLWECAGRRRGWLVGLCAVAAVETRFTLLPTLLLYGFLIASGDLAALRPSEPSEESRLFDRRSNLLAYGLVVVAAAVGYAFYNAVRWGTVVDLGYALFCATDSVCSQGLFGLKYLGYELYAFFVRGPALVVDGQVAVWPYLAIDRAGLALTFTSPALVMACWVPCSRVMVALWMTTVLVAIPSFLYYVDGWRQVGMRHALDFEPFVFVLMAIALRDCPRWWFSLLLGISMGVGVWEVWYWGAFMTT